MSGTLFGLGLSQQLDANGRPMSGCLLYLYEANTSDAVSAYQDTGLTLELPWPIAGDANGRIPAFWLDDGSYRARLTDSTGAVQFDEPEILAIGPSTGAAVAPGTDANAILRTGDVKWRPAAGELDGWVRIAGRTIGNVGSGATERAHADTQALFEHIYQNFSNALCPTSGTRTGNATDDFNSSFNIQLLDMRARGAFGLDQMGPSAAGNFSGITFSTGSAIIGGSAGGAHIVGLTQANLPNVALAVTIPANQGSHTHGISPTARTASGTGLTTGATLDASSSAGASVTQAGLLPAMSGTTASINGGVTQTSIDKMPWFMLGTWYMRL